MSEKGRAIWFLALLSPITAELLSGSSPPLEFFSPFGFLLMLGMYGAGVLLVRELIVIWKKGWASTLVLGFAYGIIEEGIAVKSFFDPGWVDLGELSEFGRYAEVNWVWAVWLTIFHSMISICLPILILNLWYPQFRQVRLLTDDRFRLVGVIFLVDISFAALAFISIQDYYPPALQYLACFPLVAALIILAKELPADLVSARHESPSWAPWKFVILGFGLMLMNFIVSSSILSDMPAVVTIVVLIAMNASVLMLFQHKLGRTGNELHMACVALGLVLLFIILSPVHEVANGMLGMSVVGIGYSVFMLTLIRKSRANMAMAQ